MLFLFIYCSISLQSWFLSSKCSLSFRLQKLAWQATDLCLNNSDCCCKAYSFKPHCHHIVGTVQLYKYWPLAHFPLTVSKCDTRPRHHQCLWSTVFRSYDWSTLDKHRSDLYLCYSVYLRYIVQVYESWERSHNGQAHTVQVYLSMDVRQINRS